GMYDTWHTLTLFEQLGNAGSDYERALRWKIKGQHQLFLNAFARTLDQIDLTLADHRWAGPRRREIARLREEVCRELSVKQVHTASAHQLQRYFMCFATAARKSVGI
ncbi:MAG: hypothetical protein ACREQV_07135, partial [Candidatus Binatia bacterium]